MIKDTEIEIILKDHRLWFDSGHVVGKRAIFENCNLQGIDFSKAFLRDVKFINVDLRGANLSNSNLRSTIFIDTDLSDVNMSESDLSFAHFYNCTINSTDFHLSNLSGIGMRSMMVKDVRFREAILTNSDFALTEFHNADFGFAKITQTYFTHSLFVNANFFGATIYKVYFDGAQFVNKIDSSEFGEKRITPFVPSHCPSHGSFIGWKKVYGKIVKLEIPEDALRMSSTSEKCRCNKAKVLAIEELDGTPSGMNVIVNEKFSQQTVYHVGRMVYPDKFNENRWNECSNGIHFFIDRESAVRF